MTKQLVKKNVKQSTMIYQHNDLIGSVYRLTMPGKRVLSMALGIVGSKDVKPDGSVRDEFPFLSTITVADYAAIFGLPLVNASQDLYTGTLELTTAAVTVYSQRDGKDVRDIFPWLHHTNIEEAKTERGKYTLTLNPDLMRYVGLLEQNFTEYDLLNCGRLTSFNQMRLYEQFAQHKNHGKKGRVNYGLWVVKADFFKGATFDLSDSVKKYPTEIKRNFLNTALDAINDTTDLFVEFTDKGRGKPWEFKIHNGDLANARREKWRKERAEAELKAKEEKRLARLRKKMEKASIDGLPDGPE